MGMFKKLKGKIMQKPVFYCFLFIFIMFFLPTLVQVRFNNELRITKLYLGLPGVLAGDEPHYMVVTTSLINDHDIYIRNNYENTYYSGGCDVSFHYINNTNPGIGMHVMFYDPKNKVVVPHNEYREYDGRLEQLYKDYGVDELREIPNRPIGLPLFSSFFLWPLKGTCLIEHGAIYLTLILSFIGTIFFYLISLHYVKRFHPKKLSVINAKVISLAFTLVFALCTQYWHYSKSYFTEPYLAVFLLAAFYLFFIKEKSLIPGFILSIGFIMKYPFGMYFAIFGVILLLRLKLKRIIYFTLGALPSIAWVLYYNWLLTGNILNFGRTEFLKFGNYIYGLFVWLFSTEFGLLTFAPFLIFSIFGFVILYKRCKNDFFVLSLVIFPYMLFWTSYELTQIGAGGYSARYFVPLLAFFVILVMIWYINNKNKSLEYIFYTLIIISFLINIQSAFLYFMFWSNPPWVFLNKILELLFSM